MGVAGLLVGARAKDQVRPRPVFLPFFPFWVGVGGLLVGERARDQVGAVCLYLQPV